MSDVRLSTDSHSLQHHPHMVLCYDDDIGINDSSNSSDNNNDDLLLLSQSPAISLGFPTRMVYLKHDM